MSPRIAFLQDDLATARVDAIVNPTNAGFLIGHAGINGALLARGGEVYARACEKLANTAMGEVWPTAAGNLDARYVLHAVSPIWSGGDRGEQTELHRLHTRVLMVAAGLGCNTVGLPAIGCGAHRFPPEVAAAVALDAVESVLKQLDTLSLVAFYFTDPRLLHDYAMRSRLATPPSRLAILRNELVDAVRSSGEAKLADAVAEIRDEETLRSIKAGAHELSLSDGEGIMSVALNALYAEAARRALA